MARMKQLQGWLTKVLPHATWPPKKLAGDASFRVYYRVTADNQCYVVMDAPPEKESCHAFVAIDRSFRALGLSVPEIFAEDASNGFLLMTDFGDTLYLDELNDKTADRLYSNAIESLLRLQTCQSIDLYQLPRFDDSLYQHEFNLFYDWFLIKEKKRKLTQKDSTDLRSHYNHLTDTIKQQPFVCVHRDYHSRNLMVLPKGGVGILDFQDAVWGPVTYDILSLLRDCYIDWPQERVLFWLKAYHEKLLERNIIQETSFELFHTWFDWVSVQRHIKCLGIFTRLTHLYNKPSYHQYLPRTIHYLKQVCERHQPLAFFLDFL